VLSIAYGVGVVLASVVGLLIAVVLIDYLLNLHPVPRVLAMLASIGVLGYLTYRFVVKPALAALSLSDVAGRLEKAFPQFEDRLRSTVNFASGENPGSDVMQSRVIEQATTMARDIDLSTAIVAKPAVLSMSSAIGSMIVLILISTLFLSPNIRSIITSRLFSPFHAQNWPKRVQIEMQSSVPTRVPVGQKIDLKMKLARGDKASMRPILYYQVEGGPVQQQFMTRGPNGEYQSSLDARLEAAAASGTLKSWIKAGDDEVNLNSITIVPRLAIKAITAQITPPEYVPKRTPVTQDMAAAPVVSAEGSDIAVSIKFNKALSSAAPVLEPIADAKAPAVEWTRDGEQVAVAMFRAVANARFRGRAVDVDSFSNTALEEYELIVRPDTNLNVQIENPRRSEECTPQAFVKLQGMVEDDCGVDWVKLSINRLQPNPQHWDIDLVKDAAGAESVAWQQVESSPERIRQRLNYQWELTNEKIGMKLAPGDVIEYQLVARDNFNLDGKRHDPVGSSKLRITIVSQAEIETIILNDMRTTKNQTAVVRNTQDRTKQETTQLAQETKDKDKMDAADKQAAERLAQQQSSTASSTKQLAARMENTLERLEQNRSENKELKDIAKSVKESLERTSESPMKDATQEISNAAEPKADKETRNDNLARAENDQEKALSQLDAAMGKMSNIGTLETAKQELSNILKDQKENRKTNEELSKNNVGKKPEQMSAEDRKKLEENASKQEKLAERTQKAMSDMAKQAKDMEKSDPAAAQAMQQAAQQGQDSKVPQGQKSAAASAKQNQQASAQQQQQQVELGLEKMLNELQQAQNAEAAKLREHLATLQKQVDNLIRRQSGHNLDNVLLQGPAALAKLDPAVMDELTKAAERKANELKAPAQRQLNEGQEQTEANTRDLGRTADSKPETAEIAAGLLKAAGKMERAIVSLRAASLTDAYPPQVDALAALKDAKAKVDEKKQKADEQAQQAQKEALRQRYVKIKEQQDKVNAETTRLEKARDPATKELARMEALLVAKLAKDQTALAEQIAAIEEDLKKLESTVYVWANKDIQSSMGEVKDDLTASKTGVPTQAEETRISEQLAAMIDNLKEPPPDDKKFDSKGGGGQGGGGGKQKKMPTTVELQMLKSLQQAVNKSTKTIAGEKAKDQNKLLALGNRQQSLRNLLGEVVKKAGAGDIGPAPDNKDQLPEELDPNAAAKVDPNQALIEKDLLGDDAATQKLQQDLKLVGTRMGRSGDRLSKNNDPGQITQAVQDRIVLDLDALIEEAKKNQQQGGGSGQPKPGEQGKQGEAQASGGQQPGNQGGNQPGQGAAKQPGQSSEGATGTNNTGVQNPHDLKSIEGKLADWGNLTPRERQAIIDSKDETVIKQYEKLIQDYYEALSKAANKK
jgi:hypothetical protein